MGGGWDVNAFKWKKMDQRRQQEVSECEGDPLITFTEFLGFWAPPSPRLHLELDGPWLKFVVNC